MDVVGDTSGLVTCFHEVGEHDVEAARALLAAHEHGILQAHALDLAVYELGNVLTRSLRWPVDRVIDQVEDLLATVGQPLHLNDAGRVPAATLDGEV